MAWSDGREELDRLIEHNKKCHPDDVIYECHEWFSPDGITWTNIDDNGNTVTYNPDGDDIIGQNIMDEVDLEAIDKWYADHFEDLSEKYEGRVIAVVDEKVVAIEDTEKEADEAARKQYPGKIPFVTYVPKKEDIECLL